MSDNSKKSDEEKEKRIKELIVANQKFFESRRIHREVLEHQENTRGNRKATGCATKGHERNHREIYSNRQWNKTKEE